MPRISVKDLPPQDHDEEEPGSGLNRPGSEAWKEPKRDSGFATSPQDLRDSASNTAPGTSTKGDSAQGSPSLPYGRLFERRMTPGFQNQGTPQSSGPSDQAEFNDLVYRPKNSPEDEQDQRSGFFQNVAAQGPATQQRAQFSQSATPQVAAAAPPAPQQPQGSQPPNSTGQVAPKIPLPSKPADPQAQANMARNALKPFPENERLERAKALIDLKVQYTALTKGIPGLQAMVAGEAGFSKNIQAELLKNYLNGAPVKQYKMSHQDVHDSNIGLNFSRSAEFLKALQNNTTGTTPKEWTFKANVPAIAGTSATLGNFTAQVEMKVTSRLEKDKNGNLVPTWEVSGTFAVNDTYDFDIVDKEAERAINDMVKGEDHGPYQGRTQAGQLKTLLVSRIPGTGFAVTSDPITFTQSSKQSTAQIITHAGTYPPPPSSPPPSR